MTLLNNYFKMNLADKLFYGIGIIFTTAIVVVVIFMLIHIVQNPELISFGSF